MSANAFAIAFALVAGIATSIQVVVNGALGKRIGVLEATAFGAMGGALIMAAIVVVAGQGMRGVGEGFREPPWLWLGGVMGAIIVTGITYSPPRIGTFGTIALLIAGQLFMGVVLDALGLFGLERIPLNWERVVGLAFLAGGALLVLRR